MAYKESCHAYGLILIAYFIGILSTLGLAAQQRKVLTHSSEIVTPPSLEADADALIAKWNQGYSTNLPDDTTCGSYRRNTPQITSEMLYRDRIFRLPTAMNIPLNEKVRNGIEIFLTRKKTLISAMLSLGDYYFPTIEAILDKYKLPLELKYLIIVESGMNPTAVSPAGAAGLWQFMAPTAKAYGLTINSLVDERLDLEKSTDAAARYLRDLYQVYHDWFMALAAYNCGLGNLNRAVYRAGGRTDYWSVYPFLPRETQGYVPLFIGAFYAMHYHVDHQICPKNVSLPLATDTLIIHHSLSIRELSEAAGVSQSLFQLLNPQYKQGTVPGHISPCVIRLPMKAINRLDRRLEELYENVEKVRLGKMTVAASELSAVEGESTEEETLELAETIAPSAKTSTYTIRKGDTLAGIAKKHGITMDQLMKANSIKSTQYKLVPGKKLTIPLKGGSSKVTKTKATSKSKKKSRRRRR